MDDDNDMLNRELSCSISNGKEYLTIVLPDTCYLFKVSEIAKLSTVENNDIDKFHCCFSELAIDAMGQSGIVVNDTVILFNTGGNAIATSLYSGEKTTFQTECSRYNPHCNVANYYQKEGRHYVYLSEWDGGHRCFVEELRYNTTQKKWESKLVQVLSMRIDDSIRGYGNMDWIIDTEAEMIYTQTYKDGSSTNATALVFLQFKLPAPFSQNSVVFALDNLIRRVEIPIIHATQDKFIYKGKLYVASGLGDDLPGRITVLDLSSFKEEDSFDLSYRNDEPEALQMYKDNILLFYWKKNYSIQNKHSLFIHFKNGLVISYPQSLLREIKYI